MGLYSFLRSARWKFIGYRADECKRLLNASEKWSRAELVEYRNEKLRRLISHCYQNVPYYRRLMQDQRLTPTRYKSRQRPRKTAYSD